MTNLFKNKIVPILKWFLTSFIWVFLIMLTLDIVTKQLIIKYLDVGDYVILIPGFLRVSHVLNYNAAFGIGVGNHLISRVLYIVIASIGSIGIISFYSIRYKKINPFVRGCLMLILTCAIGNLIDRVFYGPEYAVIDFIDFYGIWQFVFNIADCGVVIGAILLIVFLIVQEVKDYRAKQRSESIEFSNKNKTNNK